MSQHLIAWLEAFHDGELSAGKARQMEDHLSQCADCRQELSRIQTLSTLLQESPAASKLMSEDRFVAQVALQLPRRPVRPGWQRGLETGWRLVPLGLLGTWSFVQTTLIVSGVLLFAARLGFSFDFWSPPTDQTALNQWLNLSHTSLGELGETVVQTLSNGGPLGWVFMLGSAIPVMIGVLYWSWLASWWIRHRPSLITE